MKFASATNLKRKSGVAQWRDLRLSFNSHADCKALVRASIARRTPPSTPRGRRLTGNQHKPFIPGRPLQRS
jgi:hypothetical protein